ncbi:hypothetical protein PR729_08305 [Providencia rettgeri]|nr:hypothetical protein PR729_08305 [Providencia rettgeri]
MAASVLSFVAFGASAVTITATGDTLASTEAIIAAKAKAKAAGADSYTITSARMGNFVTMSAETK